jgi:hypothetical protein
VGKEKIALVACNNFPPSAVCRLRLYTVIMLSVRTDITLMFEVEFNGQKWSNARRTAVVSFWSDEV